MSEYEYGDDGFDPAAADDGPDEYTGPSRDEWEAAQTKLAQVSELVDAVESQTQQRQAAEMYAQRDEWLGDPTDDPTGYAERVWQIAQETAEAKLAPFEQWFDSAAQEYVLQQAATEAQQLVAGHEERLGIEIDFEVADQVTSNALTTIYESVVAQGMSPAAAKELIFSPEWATEALRLYAENVAHIQAMRHGDETALVSKYFNTPRSEAPRPARAQYRDAQHRAVAEQALRGQ